jgi:hypothetical protein
MTPIKPTHRIELDDELEDIRRMIRCSQYLTYQEVAQRIETLRHMLLLWCPIDGDEASEVDRALAMMDSARNLISQHLQENHETNHP